MTKKGLLIVSFGTSFWDAFERDIIPVEKVLAATFPEHCVQRAFGSRMIICKLKTRDGVQVDSIPEALERMAEKGIEELLIQPTYLIHGKEYDCLMEAIRAAAFRFQSVSVGRPLLSLTEDYQALADGIAKIYPQERGSLVLMGHGTEHYANAAYPALETFFRKQGHSHVFIGTVEGYPDIDLICRELQESNAVSATLSPLMLVAGDHANNDMASDEPDSWKSKLQKIGVKSNCVIRGLGSYSFVQDMFVNHAREAKQVHFGKRKETPDERKY